MGAGDAESEPAAAADPGAPMSQDDIDALLSEMGTDDGPGTASQKLQGIDDDQPMSQDDIDALLSSMGSDGGNESSEESGISQSSIDAMVAELSGGTNESVPGAEGKLTTDAISRAMTNGGSGCRRKLLGMAKVKQ